MKRYDDGFTRIYISSDLRNYVEKYTYEKNRYEFFLKLINDSWRQYMTDDEYNSSYEYFRVKYAESCAIHELVLSSIYELYRDQINKKNYSIDFRGSCIILHPDDPGFDMISYINNLHKNEFEQYSDMIPRLYDQENIELKIAGSHVMSVTLQVTDDCNMKCTYCYQHNKGCHKMTFDTAKKFIDMILDGGEKTNKYLNPEKLTGIILDFIGGEPFMEIDLIDQICDYFLAQLFRRKHHWVTKFMFSFSSNGLLYFEEKVQKYIDRYGFVTSIGVSIDGDKELHDSCRIDLDGNGTYDRAIEAAQDLMIHHNSDHTKITISPYNVHLIAKAVENMIQLGYKMIHLNCVYEEGWKDSHASILYYQLIEIINYLKENNLFDIVKLSMLDKMYCKPMNPEDNKNWCGGAGLMMAVDWKGDCFPCLRYMESSVGNNQLPYIIGNIEKGLCNTEKHLERVECMKCVTRKSQSTDECFNCPIASGCGWCSAYNYECFGTVNKRATFICCTHKARSLANAYYLKLKTGNSIVYCPEEWAIPIIGKEEYDKLIEFCKE